MKWAFWIPGTFRLTNRMLSDLRAAGFAHAWTKGTMSKPARDRFNDEVRRIRETTALLTRAAARERHRVPVNIRIEIFGHQRHDPDAWYLVAKAAIDGMVTSKFLSSDRREVGYVSGRVLQCPLPSMLVAAGQVVRGPGAIVHVAETCLSPFGPSDGCGHA